MQKRVSWITAFLTALLVLGPVADTSQAAAAKPNGDLLLTNSRLAVAGILKAAKSSPAKLDPKNKKQAPFWKSVNDMNSSLRLIGEQVKAKNKELPKTLSKGGQALSQLKTVWSRLGVKEPKVSGYITKLDNSFTALRSARGAEGARARKGGQLTPQEKQRFQKIQQSQAQFAAKLGPLQQKARQSGDKGTEAAIARMLAESNKIAKAQLAVDTFLAVLILLDDLEGQWNGYSYYVTPGCRDSWVQVDTWVETTYTSYDTMYWETFESYSVDTYSSWETTVDFEAGFDYEVTDVSWNEVSSIETSFEESFTYEETTWESYSEEYVTESMESIEYEEADVNMDVAMDAFEDEGLEVTSEEEWESLDEDVTEDDDSADDDDADADDADADADDDDADADADDDDADADADDDDADADADDDDADANDDDADADDEGEDDGGDDEGEDDGGDDEGEDDGGDDEGEDDGADDEAEDDGGDDEAEDDGGDEEAEDDGGDEGGDDDGGDDDGGDGELVAA
jgi:hypothetical protein